MLIDDIDGAAFERGVCKIGPQCPRAVCMGMDHVAAIGQDQRRLGYRRQAGRAQTLLAVGALRLDPSQHRCWLRDDEVALTAREFALLEELMRDPGAIATREQLEERLYGWNEEIESNAIPVHIYNLRRKLGTQAIHNVRGVGYRIGEIA